MQLGGGLRQDRPQSPAEQAASSPASSSDDDSSSDGPESSNSPELFDPKPTAKGLRDCCVSCGDLCLLSILSTGMRTEM